MNSLVALPNRYHITSRSAVNSATQVAMHVIKIPTWTSDDIGTNGSISMGVLGHVCGLISHIIGTA
jgi:hypothetical protein